MFQFYTVMPLVFLLISSYVFNRKKLQASTPYIWMISGLEGIVSYLVIYLIFFEGFLSTFFLYFLLIIGLSLLAFILFFIERDLDEELDLQAETIKNNLIVFFLTLAPFYISLTIFRFQNTMVQLLLSILIVTVLLVLYALTRKRIEQFKQFLANDVFDTTERALGFIGGSLILIIIFALLFNIPRETMKQKLNLTDNVSYFTWNDAPINLTNNFKHKTEFSLSFADELENELNDYYVMEGILYLHDGITLYSIDIETGEIIHSQTNLLGRLSGLENKVKTNFFKEDGQMYFLARDSVYKVTSENYTTIFETDALMTNLYYHNNTAYLLQMIEPMMYDIYHFENDEFTYVESVDLSENGDYNSLSIIDHTLFYQNDEVYTDYYNNAFSYAYLEGSSSYDQVNQIMYTSYYDEISNSTIYYQVTSPTSINEFSRKNLQNRFSFTNNGFVFYYAPLDEQISYLDIVNTSFELQAVHNHIQYKTFWIGNEYTSSKILNYQEIDDSLTYLQVDKNAKKTVLSLHVISEEQVGLHTPFYSHYALWFTIPTIIVFLFPITNYRKHITIIGFNESMKK